ncbi:mucin-19 [Procambarus clarkii]|uniref:mucin-19 n=1 Tax=Procambarus clarkii TaxID=6728 RepID=UPI003743633A
MAAASPLIAVLLVVAVGTAQRLPQTTNPLYDITSGSGITYSLLPSGDVFQRYGSGRSYSFNYKTPTSSRSEDADSNLNVKGRYSFRADDGRTRTINYRAGSATGFVAEGDSIPVAPIVPIGSAASPEVVKYSVTGTQGEAKLRSSSSPDGSYSFQYNAPASSRSEDADSNLNVKGRYSFRADDGRTRTISYRAGSGTGFVAEGDSIPVAPVVPAASPASPKPSGGLPASPEVVKYSVTGTQGETKVRSSTSPDGSYSFKYDAPTSSRSEDADSNLNVKGRYSFRADDGRTRTISYSAGSGTGFVAEGDSIPVAPAATAASRKPSGGLPASPEVVKYSVTGTQGEAKVRSSSSPDGSYSFQYDAPTSSRSEDADSNLNVKGRYSFRADDGRTRTISYRAGSGTGFVAEGDSIPVAPAASAASPKPSAGLPASPEVVKYSVTGIHGEAKVRSSSSPDGSYSFKYDAPTSSRSEDADSNLNVKGRYSFRADDGRTRTINYRAGSGTGFVAEGDSIPVAPIAPAASPASPKPSGGLPASPEVVKYSVTGTQGETKVRSSTSPDGSYSFKYDAPTSSRSEDADSNLNVKGRYSFRADDGRTRTISYSAGSGTGFVAEGDSIPVAPAATAASPKPSGGLPASPEVVKYSVTGTQGEAKVRSSSSPDGSYSFQYDAPASSRSEDADSNLNVKGRYSFRADDGRTRTISYRAGSGTGFVAEGDSIPVAPAASPASPKPSGGLPASPEVVKYSVTGTQGEAKVRSSSSPDGSYSFKYDAPTSSRSEDADSNLNVKGRYSFRADDGRTRTISYSAGSGTGFVAEGDSIPVAPAATAASPKPSGGLPASPEVVKYSVTGTQGEAKVRSSSSPDGSYSFQYDAPASSRSEDADSNLNVKGRYSFRADDGRTRTISYRAGSGTGFVAEGDSIPVAPAASPASPKPSGGLPASPEVVKYSVTGTQGEAKVRSSSSPDGSYSFKYDAPTSSRSEDADSNLNVKGRYSFRADDGRTRTISYRAGSGTGFVAEGDSIPVAPAASAASPKPSGGVPASPEVVKYSVTGIHGEAKVRSSSSPDGSYSFKYDAPTSSRSEDADSNLNVKGRYSFRADDGRTRTINYRAGSGTGFVAEGDSIPVAPIAPAASPASPKPSGGLPASPEVVKSSSSPDGSYSFQYDAPASSRSEDADSNLNVKGRYSFRADDGRTRTISYRAGSGTGFVAEGDSIPVAPAASPASPKPSGGLPASPEVVKYSVTGTQGEAKVRSSSPDGSYSFKYDAPTSSRSEDADSNLNVKGRYSFRADDGRTRTISYRAGSGTGFVAEGDSIPVAPAASAASPKPSGGLPASPEVVKYSVTGTHGEAKVRSSSSPDGSYSFKYDAPTSSRSEDADSNLNVKGRYSFRADDGRTRTINYRAGSGTGFVAEGDSIPVAPIAPAASPASPKPSGGLPASPEVVKYSVTGTQGETKVRSSTSPDGSYSFKYDAPTSSRSEDADSNLNVKGRYSFRADDGRTRTISYSAGSGTGFVAEGDSIPVAPAATAASPKPSGGLPASPEVVKYSVTGTQGEAKVRSSSSPDGSYSFQYDAPASSRSEDADSNLNVKGRYSFRADDGRTRTINYRAGSGTGFVAEGDSIPVAPAALAASPKPSGGLPASPEVVKYSVTGIEGEAKVRSSSSPDGSYSFQYDAPASSRSEAADSNLNVKGRYSFRADDGRTRTISYRAGSTTGFVAEGDSIPVAPIVPIGSAASPAAVKYSITGTQGEAKVRSSSSPDGSYSFQYDAPTSSRSEDADSNLNVKGRYSFRADDGRTRTISYRAGSGTGFVAEGDSIPVASAASPAFPNLSGGVPASPEVVKYSVTGTQGEAKVRSSISRDGSYSFKYDTPTSSRSEDADSNLNIRGNYRFISTDGQTKRVTYRAGAKIGFVAEGSDIPRTS